MCGICGSVDWHAGDGHAALAQTRLMLAALAHRAPDGGLLHRHGAAVLGAGRLAIRDLATPRPPLWVGPVVTVTSFVTVMTSSKVQGNPSGWCR